MYQIDLECKKGETFTQTLRLQDSGGTALDLDGYTAQCQIRHGDALVANTLVSIDGNNIKLELTAAQTYAIEVGTYEYDLAIKKLDVVSYVIGGRFYLKPAVTVLNSVITDGVALWGQIKGTLSLQTDLQNALDTKANAEETETLLAQKAEKTDVIKGLNLKADSAEVTAQISTLTASIRNCDAKCDTKLDSAVIGYEVYTYDAENPAVFPIQFPGTYLTVVSAYVVNYGRLRYFNFVLTAVSALTTSTQYRIAELTPETVKVLPSSGYTSGNTYFSGTNLYFAADKAYAASSTVNLNGWYFVE